eukprot:gene33452-37802_t
MNHVDPSKRGIAMVFQSYALYPHMTVRENISFGLGIRKVPKAEQDVIVNREQIIGLMKDLRAEGRVMLVSTHNLGSVPDFCDRTIFVKGTVIASGKTEDTFTEENLKTAFGGALRHFVLAGRDLHDDDDGREMLATLVEPFTYDYMRNAILVSALVGGVCGFLSAYLMLKGWSLIGDALSHAIVPGVAGAHMLGLPFAFGAFLSGGLAAIAILFLNQ